MDQNFPIDLLERHRRVPDKDGLLDDYVKRFAGQRLSEGLAATLVAEPEPEPVFETAPAPVEMAVETTFEATFEGTEPEAPLADEAAVAMYAFDEALPAVETPVVEASAEEEAPATEAAPPDEAALEAGKVVWEAWEPPAETVPEPEPAPETTPEAEWKPAVDTGWDVLPVDEPEPAAEPAPQSEWELVAEPEPAPEAASAVEEEASTQMLNVGAFLATQQAQPAPEPAVEAEEEEASTQMLNVGALLNGQPAPSGDSGGDRNRKKKKHRH